MSAPSFSSFPPSYSSFPDVDSEPGPSKSQQHDGRSKEKRERKEKHRKRRRSQDENRHRHPTIEEDYISKEREILRGREEDLSTGRPLFYSDRKGDDLNIKYGGIYAGDIPRYHLVGRGRKILGLADAWTAIHRGRNGIEVDIGGRRKYPSLSDSSTRHMLKAAPVRTLLSSSQDNYRYREVDGFLRLPTKRVLGPTDRYRNIAPSKDIDDSEHSQFSSDSESVSDDNSDADAATSSLQTTLRSLEQQLTTAPTSIPTWLNLLFHTLSTVPDDAKNAATMRADITVSVLSRALNAHSDNKTSKTLYLRYLLAGETAWPESKLQEEWEKALTMNDIELWMEWLDWRIRTVSGVADIAASAERVLSTFRDMDDEIGLLRVQWRIAIAFRDSGFSERGMAILQAQAELTYYKPANVQTEPFPVQLERLEEFWDAEVLRAGEKSALGWSTWELSGRPESSDTITSKHDEIQTHIPDPYMRWAHKEQVAEADRIFPARAGSLEEESDPYAVVLFSDIRPFLLDLRSQRTKESFRLIWLQFIGLHIPGFATSLSTNPWDNTDDRWSTVAFRRNCIESIFPHDTSLRALLPDSQAGVLIGREQEHSSPLAPIKQWGHLTLEPLARVAATPWGMWTSADVACIDETAVQEIFRQCKLPGSDVHWTMLQLAFEAAKNTKHAIKFSKSLLATAQDSLLHWGAHARLERIRGRFDDARKIYETILASASSQSPGYRTLWWDWAEMEWLLGADDASLKVILRAAGSSGSGGIAILRAKRFFAETFSTSPVTSWKEREAWVKLNALLELLVASSATALAVFDSFLDKMDAETMSHESLTVASLLMLYTSASILRNPQPPALLRERTEKAVELYPNNTILVGLFLEAQKGQAVWGRVNLVLGDHSANTATKPKDVARRIIEVWAAGWQRGRWKIEEERTRAGLSSAVQDPRTRHSPTLWRIYLEFEIRTNSLQRAKKLLFRAIAECPLVKELYLLAFGPLRSVFSTQELNEMGVTMAERGIRLRQGLDEALEGRSDPTAQGRLTTSDEEAEDEIEYNARELRRLMPY